MNRGRASVSLAPTGEANITKISRFGFFSAADSMAHAWLAKQKMKMFQYFNEYNKFSEEIKLKRNSRFYTNLLAFNSSEIEQYQIP